MLNGAVDSNTLYIVVLILSVFVAALIALVIVLIVHVNRQKLRLDAFLEGSDGLSVEETINEKFERLQILEEKDNVEDSAIRDIYRRLKGAYQRMGIIKYNAFMEAGGKMSFAVALLDETNSGFILNVMNSRDGSYCYLKEIDKGQCEIALGKEEGEALEAALYSR